MSLVQIKPYFVTRLKALGYKEHEGARTDNIPENKLHKSFHVDIGDVVSGTLTHGSLELSCPVTVKVFFKGVRTESARDQAIAALDEILSDVMASANRLNAEVKTLRFINGKRDSYSEDNDSEVVLTMNFQALVINGL